MKYSEAFLKYILENYGIWVFLILLLLPIIALAISIIPQMPFSRRKLDKIIIDLYDNLTNILNELLISLRIIGNKISYKMSKRDYIKLIRYILGIDRSYFIKVYEKVKLSKPERLLAIDNVWKDMVGKILEFNSVIKITDDKLELIYKELDDFKKEIEENSLSDEMVKNLILSKFTNIISIIEGE